MMMQLSGSKCHHRLVEKLVSTLGIFGYLERWSCSDWLQLSRHSSRVPDSHRRLRSCREGPWDWIRSGIAIK